MDVRRNGDTILTIESNCLSGKPDFTDEEARIIRAAGEHLIAFIGGSSPLPPPRSGGQEDTRKKVIRVLARDFDKLLAAAPTAYALAVPREQLRILIDVALKERETRCPPLPPEARTGWQPISEHDGSDTPVLVALIRDGRVCRVSDAKLSSIGFYTLNGQPCHWRTHFAPLPAAPTETREDKR